MPILRQAPRHQDTRGDCRQPASVSEPFGWTALENPVIHLAAMKCRISPWVHAGAAGSGPVLTAHRPGHPLASVRITYREGKC